MGLLSKNQRVGAEAQQSKTVKQSQNNKVQPAQVSNNASDAKVLLDNNCPGQDLRKTGKRLPCASDTKDGLLGVGCPVTANFCGLGKMRSAVVVAVNDNGTLDLVYVHGAKEVQVSRKNVSHPFSSFISHQTYREVPSIQEQKPEVDDNPELETGNKTGDQKSEPISPASKKHGKGPKKSAPARFFGNLFGGKKKSAKVDVEARPPAPPTQAKQHGKQLPAAAAKKNTADGLLGVGCPVTANFCGLGKMRSAVVLAVNDSGTLDLVYVHGAKEVQVSRKNVSHPFSSFISHQVYREAPRAGAVVQNGPEMSSPRTQTNNKQQKTPKKSAPARFFGNLFGGKKKSAKVDVEARPPAPPTQAKQHRKQMPAAAVKKNTVDGLLGVGCPVTANFCGLGKMRSAVVVAVNDNGTLDLVYVHGAKEVQVSRKNVSHPFSSFISHQVLRAPLAAASEGPKETTSAPVTTAQQGGKKKKGLLSKIFGGRKGSRKVGVDTPPSTSRRNSDGKTSKIKAKADRQRGTGKENECQPQSVLDGQVRSPPEALFASYALQISMVNHQVGSGATVLCCQPLSSHK